MSRAIAKHGPENVTRTILLVGSGRYVLLMERAAIARFGTILPAGYNMTEGGDTAPSKSAVVRAAISAASKRRAEQIAADTRERWTDPEHRERQRASRLATNADPDLQRRRSATMLAHALRWITDGTQARRLPAAEPLPEGWRYGRGSTPTAGSRWINDGTTDRRLPAGEPVPEGWCLGNTSRGKPKPRRR